MIAIIDYGAGNIRSIKNALDYLGAESKITGKAEDILKADKIVFPGVGSFGDVMKTLKEKNLIESIKTSIEKGKPFLGICIGFQVLFEESEESPKARGLNILKGKVIKFKKGKIPHIGWNKIKVKKGIFKEGYFYFVNSYHVVPNDKSMIATTTDYYIDFVSAVQYKNITAVQFHPEKSGNIGLETLKEWLKC